MIRILSAFVLGLACLAFVGSPMIAAEDKEEKLEGKITCPKCDLAIAEKCGTVIKVGEKVYWFDEESNKKHHKEICTEAKQGTVVGKVKKDGEKLIISVSKLEYKK